MLLDVRPHFSHGVANGFVIVESRGVLAGVPLHEAGELLADGLEETDNNTNGSALHVVAELLDLLLIRLAVMAVELHQLPDGKQDRGNHEDGRPVAKLVTLVDRRVEARQLLKNILLKLTPHLGKSTLDLKVDHDWCNSLAGEARAVVVNATHSLLLFRHANNHSDMKSQGVGEDELEGLADDWSLSAGVVLVCGVQDLSEERSAFKVLVNKLVKTVVEVHVDVLGELGSRDTSDTGRQLGGAGLILGHVGSLNPVHLKAVLVDNVNFAGRDREEVAEAVSNVKRALVLRKALDVVDREAKSDMALVVVLPVVDEEANVLDVNTSAGHLPETGVGRTAAGARVTLVASLLEELATKAGAELPDLMCLLPLVRTKRTPTTTDTLLRTANSRLANNTGLCFLDGGLGGLGNGRLAGRTPTAPHWW